MAHVCGGKTRSGGLCRRPAGWGTKHPGDGRCKLHAGSTPRGEDSPHFKTGRYSKFLNASLQAKLDTVSDDNPLDLLPELNVQRALFADYASRFAEGYRLSAADVNYLMIWSAEIGKSVERIVKLRNDTALTAAEIALIAARIPEIVVKYIPDADKQQQFIRDLFATVGGTSGSDARQLTEGTSRQR